MECIHPPYSWCDPLTCHWTQYLCDPPTCHWARHFIWPTHLPLGKSLHMTQSPAIGHDTCVTHPPAIGHGTSYDSPTCHWTRWVTPPIGHNTKWPTLLKHDTTLCVAYPTVITLGLGHHHLSCVKGGWLQPYWEHLKSPVKNYYSFCLTHSRGELKTLRDLSLWRRDGRWAMKVICEGGKPNI